MFEAAGSKSLGMQIAFTEPTPQLAPEPEQVAFTEPTADVDLKADIALSNLDATAQLPGYAVTAVKSADEVLTNTESSESVSLQLRAYALGSSSYWRSVV